MKRSQIILLSIALVLSGVIYIPIVMNKKEYKKDTKEERKVVDVPTTKVIAKTHNVPLTSYGQVSPNTELMISFEVQGKLIQGDKRLKPGVSFRKGQVLYKVDGQEAEYSLIARRMSLASIITQALPDFVLDMPQEKEKWEDFLINLTSLRKKTPVFPQINSRKEKQFWTVRNVPTEYFNILAQEKRIEKYTYTAPFSGTVTDIYSEPGSIVNPGAQIAKIAQTGTFEIKVPIALNQLDLYKEQKTARFTDPLGNLVATGSILRISDVVNQRTQSADVYYSVKPADGQRVYSGLYLNVEIDYTTNEKLVILPRTAVNNNKVLVLEGTKLHYVDVLQKNRKPDSVYVSGLRSGQEVVIEQMGAPIDGTVYKSIQR